MFTVVSTRRDTASAVRTFPNGTHLRRDVYKRQVEFVSHELVELLFALDEVRDKFDAAVGVSAERESSLDAEFFSSEGRGDIHQLGFPVIKHLPQVAGGFESLFVDAPFLFEHIPVDFRLVDSLPLGFLRHGCLRLSLVCCLFRRFGQGFRMLGLHGLLDLVPVSYTHLDVYKRQARGVKVAPFLRISDRKPS